VEVSPCDRVQLRNKGIRMVLVATVHNEQVEDLSVIVQDAMAELFGRFR
jgi:hypothetical protein